MLFTSCTYRLEEEYIPNAGSVSEGLIPENSHFKIEFTSGTVLTAKFAYGYGCNKKNYWLNVGHKVEIAGSV